MVTDYTALCRGDRQIKSRVEGTLVPGRNILRWPKHVEIRLPLVKVTLGVLRCLLGYRIGTLLGLVLKSKGPKNPHDLQVIESCGCETALLIALLPNAADMQYYRD